jgi:hypothetical protein
VVVAALGADVLVFFQIVFVEHGFATGTFDPQTFRYGSPVSRVGLLDFGRQQFF